MDKYYADINHCRCHPETCCCNDWAVFTPDNEKYETFFHKDKAEKLAILLNQQPNKVTA